MRMQGQVQADWYLYDGTPLSSRWQGTVPDSSMRDMQIDVGHPLDFKNAEHATVLSLLRTLLSGSSRSARAAIVSNSPARAAARAMGSFASRRTSSS